MSCTDEDQTLAFPLVARRSTDSAIPTPKVIRSSNKFFTCYQTTRRETTVMQVKDVSFPMTEIQRSVCLVPFIQCYVMYVSFSIRIQLNGVG
jgi:hypothetical protein